MLYLFNGILCPPWYCSFCARESCKRNSDKKKMPLWQQWLDSACCQCCNASLWGGCASKAFTLGEHSEHKMNKTALGHSPWQPSASLIMTKVDEACTVPRTSSKPLWKAFSVTYCWAAMTILRAIVRSFRSCKQRTCNCRQVEASLRRFCTFGFSHMHCIPLHLDLWPGKGWRELRNLWWLRPCFAFARHGQRKNSQIWQEPKGRDCQQQLRVARICNTVLGSACPWQYMIPGAMFSIELVGSPTFPSFPPLKMINWDIWCVPPIMRKPMSDICQRYWRRCNDSVAVHSNCYLHKVSERCVITSFLLISTLAMQCA